MVHFRSTTKTLMVLLDMAHTFLASLKSVLPDATGSKIVSGLSCEHSNLSSALLASLEDSYLRVELVGLKLPPGAPVMEVKNEEKMSSVAAKRSVSLIGGMLLIR
jgi:hypothetical protein